MITTLALVLLAATSSTGFSSWVKDNQVHIRIYDLTKVYGPFKVYCSVGGTPDAGCATCPDGIAPEYVVPPTMIRQEWPMGGKCVEISFPCSAVGNEPVLYFTAVTLVPAEERFCTIGMVPYDTRALRSAR